jgi:hypothetical protein
MPTPSARWQRNRHPREHLVRLLEQPVELVAVAALERPPRRLHEEWRAKGGPRHGGDRSKTGHPVLTAAEMPAPWEVHIADWKPDVMK